MINRTNNDKKGTKVTGKIMFPENFGVYDVVHETGLHGALMVFEDGKETYSILVDEANLALLIVALTEVNQIIAKQLVPTNKKELN